MTGGGTGHGDNQRQPIALEARDGATDGRLSSPSAARNRDVIRDAFVALMPGDGRILEIASGTGEHAVHIAASVPGIRWITSDPDPDSRRSITAWIAASGLSDRIEGPLEIHAHARDWGVEDGLSGVFCCNMIHIAPWVAGQGLIAGAGRLLKPGGRLFVYGPFARNGQHTADSNAAFDASLRSRNAEWGVRDLDQQVEPCAVAAGLRLVHVRDMPANNLAVVFEKG